MTDRWLAIDTTTDLASVAVGTPPACASVTQLAGARVQATTIVELIDRCLRPIGVRPSDLTGIVVGDGPGGFTGLRIAWSAAKGLAQERALPLIAVPSLLAAASAAAAVWGAVPIAACFDAYRGQIFGAQYLIHGDRIEVIVPPMVGSLDEFVRTAPVRPRAVVSDGVALGALAEMWSGAPIVSHRALRPAAASLLALRRCEGAGRALEDLSSAEPDYGRPAEAQARWEAGHGHPLPDPSRSAR